MHANVWGLAHNVIDEPLTAFVVCFLLRFAKNSVQGFSKNLFGFGVTPCLKQFGYDNKN